MGIANRHMRSILSFFVVITIVICSLHFWGIDYECQFRQRELIIEFKDDVHKKLNDCFQIFSQSNGLRISHFKFQKCLHEMQSLEISEKTQALKISFTTSQAKGKKSCANPKINIAFLKTHKTASSTITNIMQRFGYLKNLTFVMPFKDVNQYRYNYIGEPGDTITHDNIIPKRVEDEYNILCNHVVYNETAFQDILPYDTFLFTIIREPFHQFISTLDYYSKSGRGYISKFLNRNISNPLSDYLQSPWKHELDPYVSMTNNKMSIDLGLPTEHVRNRDFIGTYIKKLNLKFQLVLLQEYFDESLILLKRNTCWTFKDIVYISHNVWPSRRSFNLSADDINKHRKWNAADYALYETFYQEFWGKVLKEKDFFSEVNHFRKIRQKVCLHCSNKKQSAKLTILKSKWSEGFTLTPEDCFYIRINEAKFNVLIHKTMMNRKFPSGNFSFTETTNINLTK